MRLSDRDYYLRRLQEERALAADTPDEAIARTHQEMAEAYAEKLAALGVSQAQTPT